MKSKSINGIGGLAMTVKWRPKAFAVFLFLYLISLNTGRHLSPSRNDRVLLPGVSGISCYVCSSTNGSDTNCEDPYHPAYSKYAKNCEVPKENHVGTFPAHFCVKIIGRSASTQESLVIRTCVLENMDSQCGVFKFGGEQLNGCILTCNLDGCNSSYQISTSFQLVALYPSLILYYASLY